MTTERGLLDVIEWYMLSAHIIFSDDRHTPYLSTLQQPGAGDFKHQGLELWVHEGDQGLVSLAPGSCSSSSSSSSK